MTELKKQKYEMNISNRRNIFNTYSGHWPIKKDYSKNKTAITNITYCQGVKI